MIMENVESILIKIRNHKSVLSKFGVRQIGVFGSYARNEQTQESDIDVLVDMRPDQENFDNLMAVYDLMESIFKNQKVEVVTKNGLSPYVGPYILNEVLYA